MNKDALAQLLHDWGQDVDAQMLVLAMTHRSYSHEHGQVRSAGSNERLEFLGDAVLQIIVTDYLFRHHPDCDEGKLSTMRAATVSQKPLAAVARGLNLGGCLLLGVGEENNGGRDKDSILSDALEALIGASYLSGGLEKTRITVENHLREQLHRASEQTVAMDWRTSLAILANEHGFTAPEYQYTAEGPDHDRTYHAVVSINGEPWGSGTGTSKRYAEHAAAHAAYDSYLQRHPEQSDA